MSLDVSGPTRTYAKNRELEVIHRGEEEKKESENESFLKKLRKAIGL